MELKVKGEVEHTGPIDYALQNPFNGIERFLPGLRVGDLRIARIQNPFNGIERGYVNGLKPIIQTLT